MSVAETSHDLREDVRRRYAGIAQGAGDCCGSDDACGCTVSETIGYTKEALDQLPEGAEMGLGCGNPISIAHRNPVKRSWIWAAEAALIVFWPPKLLEIPAR